jgi:hypothetical protein
MVISNMLKVAKTHQKKIYLRKSDKKNGVFDFYYCVQKSSAYNFFWLNFLHFWEPIQYESKKLGLLTHYCFIHSLHLPMPYAAESSALSSYYAL